MNTLTFDINIESSYTIPTPAEIHNELPLAPDQAQKVFSFRETVKNIVTRKDPRILMITGPCSIDDIDAAREYAHRLAELSKKVSDRLFPVMRTYFEKPRTTLGWKGFVYDPLLDNTFNMEKGLRESRKLLLNLVDLSLPSATEFLDPLIPQYLSDLISWAAIGARTVESQTHRQLASGLSMPVGFKNATDGAINVAVDAILAARSRHSFLGISNDGRTGVFSTKGNPFCHVVLRGSSQGGNFGSENVAYAVELMRKKNLIPSIVVDCSHGNSSKDPLKQKIVAEDVVQQITNGQKAISGLMLESYLKTGRQDVTERTKESTGLSVTDGCISWEETSSIILETYKRLS
ncbi:MAG: 3-deoxy-7-phosphoheptulonate synthase [Lentisphaeria bacterium]|nr:3-deoxy-7-phosphoheptulonate synthase [Lentisphaeria bacterium]